MTESEKIYRLLAARKADNGRLRYKLNELNNYYKNN